MTKDEFEKRIKKEDPNIDDYQIRLNKFVPASFILGFYYNEQEKIWHIYETDERGIEETIYTAENEEEAYDMLYELVLIHKWLNEDEEDE
ncbi:MAG: hypothetical protein AAGU01_05310 [Clostridiaceae bacterium]